MNREAFYRTDLTLSLVKNHLNLDEEFFNDDEYLLQLMEAAQNIVLLKTNRSFEDFEDAGICMYRDSGKYNSCLHNHTCLTNGIYKCPIGCYKRLNKVYYEPAFLQAILFVIAHFYASREPVTEAAVNKIPYTLDYLLEPYKKFG